MPEEKNNLYLKCNYSTEGIPYIRPEEYLILFNIKGKGSNAKIVLPGGNWPPRGKEWAIVQKESVKITDENNKEGLVKLAFVENVDKINSKVLARISTIDGNSAFWLPLEDIVKGK